MKRAWSMLLLAVALSILAALLKHHHDLPQSGASVADLVRTQPRPRQYKYLFASNPDAYTILCEGANHVDAGLRPNRPIYHPLGIAEHDHLCEEKE